MPRLTLRKSSDFSARFHADPPKVATMLPQCSHITRKRGVFYYRRRLPKPLTGELALSLRTRAFREAEWLARVLDAAFPRMLRRMNDAKNLADINRIAREYLRDELDFDMKLRAKASQTPVYGYLYFNEDASRPDPVAADLLWIDLELETAEKKLAKRLYEERRGIIDRLMDEYQVPEDQWNDLAFAIFCARIKKWETIRKRTLGDLEALGFDALLPSPDANPAPVAPQETGPLLSSVLPGFIKLMVENEGWRGQTLAQYQATYRMFFECCGDRPVTAYQRTDLTKFYDLLRSLPKLYSKSREWRGLSLTEIIEQSKDHDVQRITMKTVKRHFSALGRLFSYLKRRGEITGDNPAYGFEFPDKRAKEKHEDWPSEELAKLFKSPVWTGCQSESRRSRPGKLIIKDEKYWLPKLGMNLQSSTLKIDESGKPFHVQQAEQIRLYRAAWKEAGHARTPRVWVSRSIFALVDERDRMYFGRGGEEGDQIGVLSETERAIFGRSYAAEPDVLIAQLKTDEAIAEADTLLLTVPNQLGVDYNAHVIEAISSTSRRGSAGGDASVLELHVNFVAGARDIRLRVSLPHLLRASIAEKFHNGQLRESESRAHPRFC